MKHGRYLETKEIWNWAKRRKENTKERVKEANKILTNIHHPEKCEKKKKKPTKYRQPSAREHLMWKRFMMCTTLGTMWLENGRGRYIKKEKKTTVGGESTIIQKHHHQNGKRILLTGHSDPSRTWVSNGYGNPPNLFQAHPRPLRFDSMAWH